MEGFEIQTMSKIGHAFSYHYFAIDQNGDLYGWGSEHSIVQGEEPKRLENFLPKQIEGKIKAVVTGYYFTHLITQDGEVWSFGNSPNGEVGAGKETKFNIPKLVLGKEKGVKNIGCGYYHTICTTYSGEVYTWGPNSCAQLGVGDTNPRKVPTLVKIEGLLPNERIESGSGGYEFTILLSNQGRVFGSGSNGRKQISSSSNSNHIKFELVGYDDLKEMKIKKISCANYHCTAITSENKVVMWGSCSVMQRKDCFQIIEIDLKSNIIDLTTGGESEFLFYEDGSILTSCGTHFEGSTPFNIKGSENFRLIKPQNFEFQSCLVLFQDFFLINKNGSICNRYSFNKMDNLSDVKFVRLAGSSAGILMEWNTENHKLFPSIIQLKVKNFLLLIQLLQKRYKLRIPKPIRNIIISLFTI